MKLSQRLDILVLFLLCLYVLTGCTTAEVLDTMSKFNQNKPLFSPSGCREDEVLWCEGHDRKSADCICVDRGTMERQLQQLKRF
ncbi:MAG: hypothetical protein CMP35_00050 [Rickettsiales bacterium]|nr:hypothetical protein [Rickettsiales bacterium]|tara:strand:- start:181 stop:432 length:252 start_codon:yes stop_codon:yes gene_type:complete